MKNISIKNIIIALIIALSLIGTTVFVLVTVLNKDGTGDVGDNGDTGDDNDHGHIDDGGWTWD